jgi:hypothetical protein
VRDTVIAACKKNEEIADTLFSIPIDACWTCLEEAAAAVERCSHVVTTPAHEKRHSLLLMVVASVSDLTAALMSVRQGAYHPGGQVVRQVVENLACAVTFHVDDKAYEEYQRGKYHKPNAVTVAKKHVSEFGKLYGILSNNFTHEPLASFGRTVSDFHGKVGYTWVVPLDRAPKPPSFISLMNIAMVSSLAGEICEWLFADLISEFHYWERTEAHQLRSRTTRGKEKIMVATAELEKVIKASKS